MAELRLTMTETQIAKIEDLARKEQIGISELLWKKIFPNEKYEVPNSLTIETVFNRAKALNSGNEFTLESLFSYEEWKNFSNTIAIGRYFRKKTKDSNSEISQYVDFVDKKPSNLAIYRRK